MGETTNTTMTVAGSLTDVTTAFSTAIQFIAGNPVCMLFVGFAIARKALGLFKSAKKNAG